MGAVEKSRLGGRIGLVAVAGATLAVGCPGGGSRKPTELTAPSAAPAGQPGPAAGEASATPPPETSASPTPAAPLPPPARFETLPPLWSQPIEDMAAAGGAIAISQGGNAIFRSTDAGMTWLPAPVPLKLDIRLHSDGLALYASGYDGLEPRILGWTPIGWLDAGSGLPARDLYVFAGGDAHVLAVSGRRTYRRGPAGWTSVAPGGPTGATPESQAVLSPLALAIAGERAFALASPTDFPASAVQLYTLDMATTSVAWRPLGDPMGGNSALWSLATDGRFVFLAGDGQAFRLDTAAETPAWAADAAAGESLRYARAGPIVYRTGAARTGGRAEAHVDGAWRSAGQPFARGGATFVEAGAWLLAGGPGGLARQPASDAAAPWTRLPLANVPARVEIAGDGRDVFAASGGRQVRQLAPDGANWARVELPGVGPASDLVLADGQRGPAVFALAFDWGPVPVGAILATRRDGQWATQGAYLPRGLVPAIVGDDGERVYVLDYDGARARVLASGPGDWRAVTPDLPFAFPFSRAGEVQASGSVFLLQVSSFGPPAFNLRTAPIGPTSGEWVQVGLPAGVHREAALLEAGGQVYLALLTGGPDGDPASGTYRLRGRDFEPLCAGFDLLPSSLSGGAGRRFVSDGFHLYAAGKTAAGKPALRRCRAGGGTWSPYGPDLPADRLEVTSLVVDGNGLRLLIGTDRGVLALR